MQQSHINPCRLDIGAICHASQKDSVESNVEQPRYGRLLVIASILLKIRRYRSLGSLFLWIINQSRNIYLHFVILSVLRGRCLWGADFFFWWCWLHLHMNWIRTSPIRPGEHAFLPIALVSNIVGHHLRVHSFYRSLQLTAFPEIFSSLCSMAYAAFSFSNQSLDSQNRQRDEHERLRFLPVFYRQQMSMSFVLTHARADYVSSLLPMLEHRVAPFFWFGSLQ